MKCVRSPAIVGLLPRTHGSALFTRGETQALSIVTLGAPGMEQVIDTMELDEKKRFMHHYNFPPFSVGEVRPMRGPGRREIGHGALAEKALAPVAPDKEKFPYTIRVVSEVLSSNGSSSMASACASIWHFSTRAFRCKSVIGGISVGIVVGERWKIQIAFRYSRTGGSFRRNGFQNCRIEKGNHRHPA